MSNIYILSPQPFFLFFFFIDTPPTEIYPLPLHAPLPICAVSFARTSAGRLRKEAVRHPYLLPDNKRDPHSRRAYPCRKSRGPPRRPTVPNGVFCPAGLPALNQRGSRRIRHHPCGPRNRTRGRPALAFPQKKSAVGFRASGRI